MLCLRRHLFHGLSSCEAKAVAIHISSSSRTAKQQEYRLPSHPFSSLNRLCFPPLALARSPGSASVSFLMEKDRCARILFVHYAETANEPQDKTTANKRSLMPLFAEQPPIHNFSFHKTVAPTMPKRNVMASAAPYNLDSETIHLYLLLLLLLSYFAILLSVLLPPLAVSAAQ